MFWNLMSMMAATVSCWALSSVGPKTTPRLATVIRFFCWCWATLGVKGHTNSWQDVLYEHQVTSGKSCSLDYMRLRLLLRSAASVSVWWCVQGPTWPDVSSAAPASVGSSQAAGTPARAPPSPGPPAALALQGETEDSQEEVEDVQEVQVQGEEVQVVGE